MGGYVKRASFALFAVIALLAGLLCGSASAVTGTNTPDFIKGAVNFCNSIYEHPGYSTWTSNTTISVYAKSNLHVYPDASSCHTLGGVGFNLTTDQLQGCGSPQHVDCNIAVQQPANYTGIRPLCWASGQVIGGYGVWDRVRTNVPNHSIYFIAWLWDGTVNEAVTWPHC
jgi:hypothetical protein